ncbi:hypothetical protein LINPERHAP2_LOCUS16073 [Linum perenne]
MGQIGFNSRAAAFVKRSQSFVGRSLMNHHTGFPSWPGKLSDWGSLDGNLDWKIQGEELSKFRKSASFGYRSSEAVNEGSGMRAGQMGVGVPNQEQGHPDLGGGPEMLPAWMEQLYSESEQTAFLHQCLGEGVARQQGSRRRVFLLCGGCGGEEIGLETRDRLGDGGGAGPIEWRWRRCFVVVEKR